MRRLLVLRPQPGASATVQKARKLGLDSIAIPLFEIEPVAWNAPNAADWDGLLFTSANAVRCARGELRDLPVYAVGEATAEAAREAGYSIASVGEDGVDRLLGSIEPGLTLLHLCGEDRRQPTHPRQRITSIPVYCAVPVETPDLSAAPGAVALIHSPRAGRRFAELVSDRGSIIVAAISPAAADATGSGWEAVKSARQPSDQALLALAARLCNKPAL